LAELKLVKLNALFLSPFFLPRSPHNSYWDDVHYHIPPSTLSGYLFRALTYMMNRHNVRGDYLPCEIGTGLLAKVEGSRTEWYIAKKEEAVEGFKPPYIEFHFDAVSLGAYPISIVNGKQPEVYAIEKYWNIIKYIDTLTKGVSGIPYDVVLSIKTWHYAIMDGAKFNKNRINLYEARKVEHALVPEPFVGFVLTNDMKAEELFKKLSNGWFIMKTRMKNLLAIKVEGILDHVDRADVGELKFLPTPRKVGKFSLMFASNVMDPEAVKGRRRDRSVAESYLFVPNQIDNADAFMFFGNNEEAYAVDKAWLELLQKQ